MTANEDSVISDLRQTVSELVAFLIMHCLDLTDDGAHILSNATLHLEDQIDTRLKARI